MYTCNGLSTWHLQAGEMQNAGLSGKVPAFIKYLLDFYIIYTTIFLWYLGFKLQLHRHDYPASSHPSVYCSFFFSGPCLIIHLQGYRCHGIRPFRPDPRTLFHYPPMLRTGLDHQCRTGVQDNDAFRPTGRRPESLECTQPS
jgi:hypothetical protein